MSSEIARRVFGFLSVAYMARVLAVEGFGQVMIGLTVLSYVALAGSAGLHVLGTRSVARGEEGIEPGALLTARVFNTFLAYVVAAVCTVLLVPDGPLQDVILITASSAFMHALFLEWYFQGKEHMMPNAVARTLGAFVYLVVLVLLVRGLADVRLAALAAVAGDIASTAFLLRAFRSTGRRLRAGISFGAWRELMGRAIPFGAGSVLGHVSVNLPILLVAAMLSTSDAGVFSAASKLVFFLLMLDRILGTLLLPASVRFRSVSTETLTRQLTDAMRWIMLIGLPVGMGGTLLGPELVVLVYGPAFTAAGPVFSVMVWYFFLTLLHTVYTSGVIALGRDAAYRNVMTISALLYAVAISAGILAGDLSGAAAGMVLAEGLTVLLMRRALLRTSGEGDTDAEPVRPILPPRSGRIVLCTALLALVLVLAPEVHVLARVFFGGVIYLVATVALKAVSFGDYRTLLGRIV